MKQLIRLEYALLTLVGLFAYGQSSGGWWLFLALILLPDLTIAGYLFGKRNGAVLYNIGHSYIGVALLALIMQIFTLPVLWPLVLIWAVHISFDRMLGYGLKYSTSFNETHLGRIGRAASD